MQSLVQFLLPAPLVHWSTYMQPNDERCVVQPLEPYDFIETVMIYCYVASHKKPISCVTHCVVCVFSCFPEKICSIQSSKDVHMGSSFQIFCVFKKECSKLIYRDNVPLHSINLNSTAVSVSIVNLTRTTTVTCKCHGEPEPCGTDITPGCMYAT